MTEIYNFLPRPQSRENVVRCLSQGHNHMARVGFEPRLCRSQSQRSNHSTTLPTNFRVFFVFIYHLM